MNSDQEAEKKNIVIHKAVVKGHNPQHLLQLSSLHFTGDQLVEATIVGDTTKFWGDVTGES